MRIIVSPHFSDSFAEVRERWSFPMMLEAHAALDAIEEIQEYHRKNPPKTPKRGKKR